MDVQGTVNRCALSFVRRTRVAKSELSLVKFLLAEITSELSATLIRDTDLNAATLSNTDNLARHAVSEPLL